MNEISLYQQRIQQQHAQQDQLQQKMDQVR
jgi:hypothetical protein